MHLTLMSIKSLKKQKKNFDQHIKYGHFKRIFFLSTQLSKQMGCVDFCLYLFFDQP